MFVEGVFEDVESEALVQVLEEHLAQMVALADDDGILIAQVAQAGECGAIMNGITNAPIQLPTQMRKRMYSTSTVASVASDHRGHGESVRTKDDLGYMYRGGYLALVDDMRLVTEWIHLNFPDVPVYILGHSMGSMAARVYVKYDDADVDGLVLCGSPSWNPSSRFARIITGILCLIGLGHLRMTRSQRLTTERYNSKFPSDGDYAWICSDPQVREDFAQNKDCDFVLTANGSYNVMCLMGETYNDDEWSISNPYLPVYFISGEDDPTMLTEEDFHRSIQHMCDKGYVNITSALYSGMRHEVLNEIGKEEVWKDILDFMGLSD